MEKEMKIYHVETQEDYDDLMIKLEAQGYVWNSDDKPTKYTPFTKPPAFIFCRDSQRKEITIGNKSDVEECYLKKVVRYKSKGVKRMGKVVVPQFVAEYIENHYGAKPDVCDKADLIRDFDMYLECNGNPSFQKWVKNDDNFLTFITAIITNDYEVEEKKCYWRKKKEHILEFETTVTSTYLNCSYITGNLMFSNWIQSKTYQTKFTETEVKQLVSEEDFNKLEKVEADE